MVDMTDLILEKLETVTKNQQRHENQLSSMEAKHEERLSKIEETIHLLTVQNQKFYHQQSQIDVLLKSKDKKEELIATIEKHQSRCPLRRVEAIEEKLEHLEIAEATCRAKDKSAQLKGMWAVILLLSTLYAGMVNWIFHISDKLSTLIKGP